MFGGNDLKMALRYSIKRPDLANSNIGLLISKLCHSILITPNVFIHPHPTSCTTELVLDSGAGVSLVCTDNNRPPCWCYPGSRDLGMIGSKTTSRDQTFACTCARLVSSNHTLWVRGSLYNPCSCFSNFKSTTIRFSHV